MSLDPADIAPMRAALRLAQRGLGTVAPNPAVGCLILDAQGRIAGRGWTQPGGRPHAETEALRRAGPSVKGGTAYVTLEPCAHHGATPPCAEALIAAGVKRVVAAIEDPDPRVAGKGLARLRQAGIETVCGVLQAEADALNAGFFLRIREGRPLVTLKLASSLDGRIATHTGESQWITSETARAAGHLLRAQHDGIIVGIGTALSDDPMLDCRLPGLGARSPARIVADGRLRLPLTSKLVKSAAQAPVIVLTRAGSAPERRAAFQGAGVRLLDVPLDASGEMDLREGLRLLGGLGFTRVLAEGGARLAASLLRAGLADRLVWHRAARLIGGDGVAAIAGFGVDTLAQTPGFTLLTRRQAGEDVLETYARRR